MGRRDLVQMVMGFLYRVRVSLSHYSDIPRKVDLIGSATRQPDRNLRKSGGLGYGTASALEEEAR